MTAEALRWFDHWLKGADNGIMKEAKYHYATMNTRRGDEWRTSSVWPPAGSRPHAVYLGDHTLNAAAPRARSGNIGGSASFTVDYKVGCAKGTGLGPTCPQDDKGPTFSSEPLANDLELTGFPVADLWVSSTAIDGPLFAYLEDVAPDGSITMVSEGRLRASLRTLNPAPYKLPAGLPWHGFYRADAKPLVPGKPVQLVFDLQPVSYVFQAGHRYRLTLTGADPREKLRKEASPPPTLTILFDAAHPSKITLPMVDAGAAHG
jgi:putative CocE/NonD family hydrolase